MEAARKHNETTQARTEAGFFGFIHAISTGAQGRFRRNLHTLWYRRGRSGIINVVSLDRDRRLAEELRRLPGVDRVIEALDQQIPVAYRADAAREAVSSARSALQSATGRPSFQEIVASAESLIATRRRAMLKPVVNATGVLIHTNLGRVPLGRAQLDAIVAVAAGYSNLEYDLMVGKRGSRYAHASSLLKTLTGAEAALVVNNNAGGVMLALSALCSGREVIVSRGELVEIGGEFRIPDVISAAGALMIEVGTTNRTRIADYEGAITDATAAIVKVHPANYRIEGFTASVEVRDLVRLAKSHHLPLVYDLGSGLLTASGAPEWLGNEPPVVNALNDGADIVTFSCDKLLGGPQAGVVAGRSDLIDKLIKHPLVRALRVDKLVLAALEATLSAHLEGDSSTLPLWDMASTSPARLQERAGQIIATVVQALGSDDVKLEVVPSKSVFGGGSLPGTELSSRAISVRHSERSTAEIERSLRHGEPPVVGRVENDTVLLDLRTVAPEQDIALETALGAVLSDERKPNQRR